MDRNRISKHKFCVTITKEISNLTKLDNWHVALFLAEDFLIVGACIALCLNVSWFFYPVAWLVIGSRQRGLANIMHAAAHGTAAKNPTWNYISGAIFSGYLVGQQYVRYIQSHVVRHHGRFGNKEADPDYQQMLNLGLYYVKNPAEFRKQFVRNALFGFMIPKYLMYVVRDRFLIQHDPNYPEVRSIITAKQDRAIFLIQWVVILGLAFYFGAAGHLLIFWIVPLVSSAMIVGWFIELSEHFPLMASSGVDIHKSRNCQGNLIEHFLVGVHNDDYHLEHHLNPRVPMWNLKKASKIRMNDPDYSSWNSRCAGIFSHGIDSQNGDTLFAFIRKNHLTT